MNKMNNDENFSISGCIKEAIRLVKENEENFIFETIQSYTDGILAHCGITKIPKEVLKRALICFKEEHKEEFDFLMKRGETDEQN